MPKNGAFRVVVEASELKNVRCCSTISNIVESIRFNLNKVPKSRISNVLYKLVQTLPTAHRFRRSTLSNCAQSLKTMNFGILFRALSRTPSSNDRFQPFLDLLPTSIGYRLFNRLHVGLKGETTRVNLKNKCKLEERP